MSLTIDDMIDMVRVQLDESSTTNINDTEIIQVLNRAQRNTANILARKNDDMFWTQVDTTLVSAQRNYTLPDEAYGERIEMVEVFVSDTPFQLKRITRKQASSYIGTAVTTRPSYYTLQKNEIHVFPTPSGGNTMRIHYTARPEPFVKVQGRITSINTSSNFILVDTLGSDISTSVSTVNSGGYVNFIDYNTGAVLGSGQVSAIDTTLNKINVKTSSLTRSTVLGKTVATSLPSTLAVDDYVCLITGTCIPEIPDAYQDYMIQYAVVELKRSFNEDTQADFAALKELEQEVEKVWVGRENHLRVKKTGGPWRNTTNESVRRILT